MWVVLNHAKKLPRWCSVVVCMGRWVPVGTCHDGWLVQWPSNLVLESLALFSISWKPFLVFKDHQYIYNTNVGHYMSRYFKKCLMGFGSFQGKSVKKRHTGMAWVLVNDEIKTALFMSTAQTLWDKIRVWNKASTIITSCCFHYLKKCLTKTFNISSVQPLPTVLTNSDTKCGRLWFSLSASAWGLLS